MLKGRGGDFSALLIIALALTYCGLAAAAQPNRPSLTLAESPTVVASNGLVTATWATESNPTATDWIGWYAVGAAVVSGGTGPAGSQWAYTGGMSNGSLTLPAPPPGGPYELRLYLNDRWILAATSNQFTVAASSPPPPSVAVVESPTVVASNGLVTATWAMERNPTATDWIGWYAVGAAVVSGGTGPAGSLWAYTGGISNGSLTLPAPPPGGPYELRLYLNDSWILAATSNQFTVAASSPPPPSLTLAEGPAVVASNGLVTATWATESNPTATDWIGWYAVGAAVVSGGTGLAGSQWAYTGGMSNGSLTLPAPPPGGPYELRLYLNNSWILAATSNQFTVATSSPPSPPAPTLTLTFAPQMPSIPDSTPLGTVVATVTAAWSDGSAFTGTLMFAAPYADDGGSFALSCMQCATANIVVAPAGLGVAGDGGTVQNITVMATQ
jgi:uncharacterized membrane protein (DUF106 family)